MVVLTYVSYTFLPVIVRGEVQIKTTDINNKENDSGSTLRSRGIMVVQVS
jgi:hypothetical protein